MERSDSLSTDGAQRLPQNGRMHGRDGRARRPREVDARPGAHRASTPTASRRRSGAASRSTSASPGRTLPSGREIGIVDVPGHERFIRNMLAGAGGIDVALFVVAADEGFMPQSAEHLQVLDFLRVSGGVVALTKSDLVAPERSTSSATTSGRCCAGRACTTRRSSPCRRPRGPGWTSSSRLWTTCSR